MWLYVNRNPNTQKIPNTKKIPNYLLHSQLFSLLTHYVLVVPKQNSIADALKHMVPTSLTLFKFHYMWSQQWWSLLLIIIVFATVLTLMLVPHVLSHVMLEWIMICLCSWILYVCYVPHLLWNHYMFVLSC